MSGAVTLWATSQWRRRWATLVLILLVLALTGSLALGAAMTARRSVSAFDRLRESASAAEVVIFDINAETVGQSEATAEELLSRLLPLMSATGATLEEQFFVRPANSEWIPTFDLYPIVQHQLLDEPINVPQPIAGRMPDPGAPNEIALSERIAKLLNVSVGDSLEFVSASSDWVQTAYSGADPGPLDGPSLTFVVTGVAVAPIDFAAPVGTIFLSPAFSAMYIDQIASFPIAHVRLDDPLAAAAMIRSGSPATGSSELDAATDLGPSQWGDLDHVTDGLRVGAGGLLIFAAAAALAGLSLAALVIRRLARTAFADLEVLSALGLTRFGRATHGCLLLAPVITLAAVSTVVGAFFWTPNFRLGVAAQVEPDRGAFIDWPLVILGVTLLVGITLTVGAVAFMATAKRHDAPHRFGQRPALSRRVPITVGVRQALGARTAVVTATLVVATVVASLVIGASLNKLPLEPELWGAGADVVIDFGEREGGELNDEHAEAVQKLATDDRIEALTGTTLFFPEVNGSTLGTLAVDVRRGEPILTILAGRSPRTPDEVVMGRATLSRLNLEIGDDVMMTLASETETFRIVGQAAFAVGDQRLDDGAALTRDGSARFAEFNSGNRIFQILFNWGDGVDSERAERELTEDGYLLLLDPRQPPVVANLEQVERLPSLLALFFGALGLAFLGYSLAASSRARGRQSAVLGALGLRSSQLAALLRWHAAAMATCAVVIGVPAGLIAGRILWAEIADGANVGVSHTLPLGALVATVAITVLSGVAIAVIIGSRLRRVRASAQLRTG